MLIALSWPRTNAVTRRYNFEAINERLASVWRNGRAAREHR